MIASQRASRESQAIAQTQLAIAGMTCASCVGHVTRALEAAGGVDSARVNLATQRATVRHASRVDPRALIAAVAAAGYDATLLEPGAALAEDDDARRRDCALAQRRRLLILALVLFVPTLLLGMLAGTFPGKDWVMLALTLPVWGVVGFDFHRSALAKARRGTTNMDTLVSLGSTAALAYSIYATIALRPTYYETASAIVTLIFVGKYLETAAKAKSNTAIRSLLELRPTTARVRESDGTVSVVSAETLRAGQTIIVPPGERVPIDGVVIEGCSAVDVAMLTGEPLPQEVVPGSDVQTGTLNGDGTLTVRATAVGAGTVLAKIIAIVSEAQGSTPPVQRVADRVASVFVPAILAIAAVTFTAWMLAGHPVGAALSVAVAVLVVACPCALGLATPVAIMVGSEVGARRGFLFKDATALELLGKADTVVFDKTGTLTQGRPQVVGIRTAPSVTSGELLGTAAALERGSSHPLAAAIVQASDERNVEVQSVTDVTAERGHGLRATLAGRQVVAGTRPFVEATGIPRAHIDALDETQHPQATRVYVAHAGRFLGALELADPVRSKSASTVAELQRLGVAVCLVSGDTSAAVEALASQVGIARWTAQADPARKAEIVQALRAEGQTVAFVGDGINDAPALASADIGLAMGSGTDIALETAGAAIISNDPTAVPSAIALSRATMRTIMQNLFWAVAYNVMLIPLAALGIVHPILAAAAMGTSSLFVVGNSLRLRRC